MVRQADGTTFLHEYSIKDHLGNTRVTYRDDNTTDSPLGTIKVGEITQINHYYPFGMNMEGNWNGAAGSNKYQYNGKEWNDDFGLGLNDYGFRMYDPAIGRFPMVDPLAELELDNSPYNYVANNPMIFIDPDGMAKAPSSSEIFNDILKDKNNQSENEKHTQYQDKQHPVISGVLWGKGNIFERAWTWLKSGGKETMDATGTTYINHKSQKTWRQLKRGYISGPNSLVNPSFDGTNFQKHFNYEDWDDVSRLRITVTATQNVGLRLNPVFFGTQKKFTDEWNFNFDDNTRKLVFTFKPRSLLSENWFVLGFKYRFIPFVPDPDGASVQSVGLIYKIEGLTKTYK